MTNRRHVAIITIALSTACASIDRKPTSMTRIDGPAGYTVYWDLPEREDYWVPKGTDWATINRVANECGAKLETGLRWHDPYPPQFENAYFKFESGPSAVVRKCVTDGLSATPALTTYSKRK